MRTRRLAHLAVVSVSTVDKKSYDDEQPVRLCNYVDVYKNDDIDDSLDYMKATATADEVAAFTLRPGDTVLTKDSETADDIGVPAFVRSTDEPLVCGYHLAIARPRLHEVAPRYLFWALASRASAQQWTALATGVTRVGLRQSDIGKLAVTVPTSMMEQRAVAEFLDQEAAKIDALIAKQEQLVSALVEYRQEQLRTALNQTSTVWPRLQIRRLGPVLRGASPRPIENPVYFDDDGGRGWVRISDVTRSGGRLFVTQQRLSTLGASLSVSLDPGALFLSIAGSVGKPCITEVPVCIHDGFVYFPAVRWPTTDFMFRIFELGECFGGLGKLGTQLNLNTDIVGTIEIALPPPSAQELILADLESALEKTDVLIGRARELSDVLRERRTALIGASVTGQVDVVMYGKGPE